MEKDTDWRRIFKERREGNEIFNLLLLYLEDCIFKCCTIGMSITLFFCSKSSISLYWRGLVLGEKKCSSSSLALTLEYYIDSSVTFPVCYCLLQHRWNLLAMCIIIIMCIAELCVLQTAMKLIDILREYEYQTSVKLDVAVTNIVAFKDKYRCMWRQMLSYLTTIVVVFTVYKEFI